MATGGAGSGPPSTGAFAVRYAPHDLVVQCSAEYWLERLGGYSQKQTASILARRSQTAPTSTKLRVDRKLPPYRISPVSGLDGSAPIRRGIRPAR